MSVHSSYDSRRNGLGAALSLLLFAGCDKEDPKPNAEAPRVALRAFADCTEMRSYLSEVIVETLVLSQYGGYYGGRGDDWDLGGEDATNDTGDAGGDDGGGEDAPDDYTGTNVQEEGVDEPDMVKTDGSYLYIAQNQELAVVQSWPVEDLALTSLLDLDGYPSGMFLHGDYAIVFSYAYDEELFDRTGSGTRLDLVDLSDRVNPEVVRTIQIEGTQASARMIDGDVYVVLNSDLGIPDEAWDLLDTVELPEVDWDASAMVYEMAADDARETLRPYVEAMVEDWELADVLPRYTDALAGEEAEPAVLHDCTDLYAPSDTTRFGVLTIAHLDLGDDPTTGDMSAIGLLAEGWTVYASSTNLYTATTSYYAWWGWDDLEITSDVHKFSLGGNVPVFYEASGRVPGWLPSQWAMSEYDGYLRLATTLESDSETEDAGTRITVLGQTGEDLEEVGSVGGIAEGEDIYGARMMQDKGYVVTYQQIDPLWTIDLSDPTNPTVAGELEVLGYSSYLHPLDEDHLVAVGMAGDEWGGTTGVAVNVFDLTDFANPALLHQYEVSTDSDGWSYSEALWDHHAFTFDDGVLTIPAYSYDYSSGDYDWWSGAVVMDVDVTDGISERGRVDHSDLLDSSECLYDEYYEGYCDDYAYATLRRSVYIEDYLYTISDYGVKVGALATPETELGSVVFHPAE